MEKIGKYAVMAVIAFLLSLVSYITKSTYLLGFFADNAILLALAVFSIHAASSAILISQLAILGKQLHIDFAPTCLEIKKSFIEMFIWLIGIMLCAIVAHTCYINSLPYIKLWLPTALIFCIVALVAIVLDTCVALLICFQQNKV